MGFVYNLLAPIQKIHLFDFKAKIIRTIFYISSFVLKIPVKSVVKTDNL